jgi:hypothetical protein
VANSHRKVADLQSQLTGQTRQLPKKVGYKDSFLSSGATAEVPTKPEHGRFAYYNGLFMEAACNLTETRGINPAAPITRD